jgi:hypothetical protein
MNIAQKNVLVSLPQGPSYPMCPLFKLSSHVDCEPKPIRVRGKLVLEIKIEQTSHSVCLLARLCLWHTLLQK